MKTVAALAFAGAVAAQSSSSYVYSNPMTAYTALTDSRGVVTGIPTVNTDVNTNVVTSQPAVNTNVVTSQPKPNLDVNTNVVTTQPTLVTIPAGMTAPAANPYYPSGGSAPPVLGAAAPTLTPYNGGAYVTPGSPAGTPNATPVPYPNATPSSNSGSSSSGSGSGSGSSGSRSSSAPRASDTGAASAVKVSGGLFGVVGLLVAALL